MSADRSEGRNVHIYDAKDRLRLLGGLILTNGVTKLNFYSMVEIFLLFQSSYFIEDESSVRLERSEEPLAPGNYYVVGEPLSLRFCGGLMVYTAPGPFAITDEPVLIRTKSLCTGTRLKQFCHDVRERDGGCVITGQIALGVRKWKVFQAAHIFPLAYESHWKSHNYGRWITMPAVNGETINSKQNGLLLRADIHQLFDDYSLSINPDVCMIHTKT